MNIPAFLKRLFPSSINKTHVWAWAGSFFLCLAAVIVNVSPGGNFGNIEAGRVADRDIVAEQSIMYEDEKATRLRFEAQEKLVPAVFNYSYTISEEIRNNWNFFVSVAANRRLNGLSREDFLLELHSGFPGVFQDEVLDMLYSSRDRDSILLDCNLILNLIIGGGVFSMPVAGLEVFNPDVVELNRQTGTRIERERVLFENIITLDNAAEAVAAEISEGSYSPLFTQLAPMLLLPFIKENVFYSREDTQQRIAEIRVEIEPVTRVIERGQKIITRGFVVSEEDAAVLRAASINRNGNDLPAVFADLLFLVLMFGLLIFFCGSRVLGRGLNNRETFLVAGLSALYITGSFIVKNLSLGPVPSSVVFPTALIVMLPAILIHPRQAFFLALALPLGSFFTGSFGTASYVFAVVSGVVASYSLQAAEKRMDLVKAGLVIAAANIIVMTAILLWEHSQAGTFAQALFWAAFNGIASGMLVLGVLPPLEHGLNAATSFRLIELSDLNAPVLRRLFTAAPGTYSHSIMVANLAETACQDIKANPLLARVGAYYHDIGKIENPDYFVENQTDYNRHDDMAPRLSATVIRSHVKLGLEKARQLALPQQVIDIIGEHHGNSVITWFYSKALKQESGDAKKAAVNMEDFTYPGNPPRSRESAVVMLADVTEAAVRTIDKPNAVKIEKFIQELISKKVEHGQLAESELTFRDLETIKNAFVRVLVAYYHSRIEYPKIDAGKNTEDDPTPAGAAQK